MALRQDTSRHAGRAGLSTAQVQVLVLLAGEPSLRASVIADRLAVTPASMSDTLAALTRKRLVTAAADPRDARATLFQLTRGGAAIARRAAGWPAFLASAIETLAPDEQRTLLVTLTKVIRQLQQQQRISVARMCATCSYFRPHVHRGATPHHCDFVDKPISDRDLRIDCADYVEAPAAVRDATWRRWSQST